MSGEQKSISDNRHFHLDVDTGNGDSFQISTIDGNQFTFEIEEPWAGSTETGFGATCRATIGIEQLKEIYDWIGRRLNEVKTAPREMPPYPGAKYGVDGWQ